MSTHGVPPMRSRVQNEKPLSLSFSRAWVTSTHASACFDSSPTSNGSARRRRCRPSRPARRRSAPCSPWSRPRSPCACLDPPGRWTTGPLVQSLQRPSRNSDGSATAAQRVVTPELEHRSADGDGPEEDPQLADEARRRRRRSNSSGRRSDLRSPRWSEHRRLARVLARAGALRLVDAPLVEGGRAATLRRSGGAAVGDAARTPRSPWRSAWAGRRACRPGPSRITTASSTSLWPCSVIVFGKTITSIEALQVLQGEHRHQVALLGPLALEAGDHAADRRASAPSSRLSAARRWCTSVRRRSERLGAHQRVVAHVEAEHLLLEGQALLLVELERRGSATRSSNAGVRRPSIVAEERRARPCRARGGGRRCWSMICSNTASSPWRGWPSESKPPALISDSIVRLLST